MAHSEVHFEQAIKELETIVSKLESPDCTLTSALDYFEKGVRLMKVCDAELKSAEGKLSELVSGKDGEFIENILGMSAESLSGESDD